MTTRRDFLKAATVMPWVGVFSKAEEATEAPVPDDRSEYLRSLCEEGLRRRYANQPDKCQNGSLSEAVQERLDAELRVIDEVGLVEPSLYLWDRIHVTHKNDLLLSARGAAAGSLMFYALGMSQVCPVRHRVLFERFCYADRKTPFNVEILTTYDGVGEIAMGRQRVRPVSASIFKHFDYYFRGCDELEVLQRALQRIAEAHGTTMDLCELPNDDPDTFAQIQQGNTSGVFQLDEPRIQDFVRLLKPKNLDELIAGRVLFRPCPVESGLSDAYVNRKHDQEAVDYLHPIHQEILGETYGIILYQEQVMQLLRRIGGIDLSDGYGVIRAIARRKNDVVQGRRAQFMEGARQRGIKKNLAHDAFESIRQWAGYTYCKADAAAQAYISYQAAYLKAHYPVEFESSRRELHGQSS